MKIQRTEMTEQHAIQISNWKYADEYQIYNTPSWQEMVEDGWALASADKRKNEFHTFLSDGNEMVAYTRRTLETEGVMLGVGVNPKYLSMGYGTEAIKMTVSLLTDLYPDTEIFLDVRTWNKRAVRSYEKSGFIIGKTIEQETHAGKGEFFRMYYKR